MCMPFRETSQTRTRGAPNTLIKQGAKLTATWEDIWEDLPSQVRLALEDELWPRFRAFFPELLSFAKTHW